MTDTMTAIAMREDGPTLETRETPAPGTDQLAVRATAWALNNADLATERDGRIPGYEFAGTVVGVGPGTDADLIGRRVMGIAGAAFADVVVAHRRHVMGIPDGLTDAEAAPLTTALTTEHGALLASGFRAGDTVLYTAATSGIALVGMQIAGALGAGRVLGSTRSAAKAAVILAAGADVAIDGDLADGVRAATDGAGADIVLDHVGGEALEDAIQAARVGGTVMSVGRLAGAVAPLDLFALARRDVTLRSVSYGFSDPEILGRLMDGLAAEVLPAVADGRVRAVVASTHPRDRIADAMAALADGGASGKVVLTA